MADILFKTDDGVFSYRIAGICIQNGRVLLQKPKDDDGYAFPGGHSAFGETNEETLMREFREEMGADITVGELKWVAEIFFAWGDKPCHQICLYYAVDITSPAVPQSGCFPAKAYPDGRESELSFYWVPLADVPHSKVYPENAAALLEQWDAGVQHFIDRE